MKKIGIEEHVSQQDLEILDKRAIEYHYKDDDDPESFRE